MHMVTGNRREADVVVYVRCVLPAVPDDKEPEEIKEVITRVRENMSVVIAVNSQCSTKPNDNAANRDNLFLDILVDLVKLAMRNANPELHDALQKWGVGNDIKKVVFKVRLCLDEIGASTAFIRACCATRTDKLRDQLGWGTRVELRIIAGGIGVSNSESLDFADSLRFKYSVFSERGIKLYWSMRDSLDRLLDDKFEDLREARKRLKKAWANVEERKDALKNRDVALQACIKRASNENSQENGEQQWNTMGIEEDHASQRRLILEALFSAVESDEACGAALANPRLAALIVAQCKRVADGLVQTELCTLTSGTNIRQKILDPVAQSFKEITGLKLASPRIANRLLVESLRHAVFSGYKVGAESHDSITTDALMTSWGVLVDNLVYKPEPPGDGFDRVLKRNVNALFDNEKVTLYKCFDKTVGRYSISPAMLVVLHALMADAFDDTFTTIGDVFAEAMAKFLFVAAQVFCGRPVSELVDFVIGPKAIVGNNVANKCTKTIPTVLVRLRQCNDANAVWSGTSDEDELRRNAFVDISPVNLPSADVVLHIPGTITLAVKCKDVGKLSPNEIRDAFSIMDFSPKESHKFEVANPNAVNYPKKLMKLEAPVISIVYTSRMNDDDISERFDAVGPNCILAQGIGEVTEQVASSSPVEVPPMQWDDFRLSNIRRNLLQFDARRRHVDGEKSFDIAVSEGTEPNTAANNAARYARGSSREFTFASELAVVDEGKKFAKERCESPVKDDGLG